MDYQRWRAEHLFVMVPAQQYFSRVMSTFREFQPGQKPGGFSIDHSLEAMHQSTNNATRATGFTRAERRDSRTSNLVTRRAATDHGAAAGTPNRDFALFSHSPFMSRYASVAAPPSRGYTAIAAVEAFQPSSGGCGLSFDFDSTSSPTHGGANRRNSRVSVCV
jgi:hypothetical protein